MTKVRPNDPCPCGSAKKYKKCCGSPDAVYTREFNEVMVELHRRFTELAREGSVEDIENFVASILDAFPDIPEIVRKAAELNEKRGRYPEALECYRRLDRLRSGGVQDRSVRDKINELETRLARPG